MEQEVTVHAAQPAEGREAQEVALRALLRRIAVKEEDALATLYEATAGRVYGLALRVTRRADLAEEVVSDVYYQVWNRAARYEAQRGSVLGWLMVLCRSRALDRLRRRDGAQTHPDPESLRSEAPTLVSDPSDLLSALQQSDAVVQVVNGLSEAERTVFGLAVWEGLSHREIAERTGYPLGSVKTYLRRVAQLIHAVFTDVGTQSGGQA
jgi:RNA polymerase sigma-70 factor (ECF subfamily)